MVNQEQLVDAVKKTVSREDVKYVVGYEKGTYGCEVTPSFAHSSEDAEKFIFTPLCVHNLAIYPKLEEKLPLGRDEKEDTRKIGLVVKGCDSRAVVQIIQEKGLKREDVVLIGIPCTGVVNPKKLKSRYPNYAEIVEVEEKDSSFSIKFNEENHTIPKEELLFDACINCEYPNPPIYDILIGEEIKSTNKETYEKVKVVESKSQKEKWAYWEEHFQRCIRCYACRDACPLCYCKECMVDQLDPRWVRRSVNLSENTAWNIMRAYHLAGRCISCGECERVCPVNIPLMELNKKIERDVKKMFDYTSGLDEEEKPLFGMFKPDDPEDFIL